MFPYRAVAKLPEMEVIVRNQVLEDQIVFYDHYKILGNCPPTPSLSQHLALSEKSVLGVEYSFLQYGKQALWLS